jgi:hypothetical protein
MARIAGSTFSATPLRGLSLVEVAWDWTRFGPLPAILTTITRQLWPRAMDVLAFWHVVANGRFFGRSRASRSAMRAALAVNLRAC